MLNRPLPMRSAVALIHYERILMYKNANTDYLSDFTVEMINDRIKRIKYK